MKKLLVIFLLLLVTGCFSSVTDKDDDVVYKASDFLFREQNKTLVYEGFGNEFASFEVFPEFTSNGSVQRKIVNPGTLSIEVLTVKDNSLVRQFSSPETYYIYNYLTDENAEEIILKEPIVSGTKWDVENGTREITKTDVEIFTDIKTYETVEVKVIQNDMTTLEYYAKGIGLVKSVFNPGPDEITSTIKEIKDGLLAVSIDLFYPSDDFKINSTVINFPTNGNFIDLLEIEYKKDFEETESPITPNTNINNVTIVEDVLYIDLSSEFISETNAGAEYEGFIIQSVVNTFGKYFDKNKVILTINNGPYESGHFSFKVDEILEPNYEIE